MAFFTGLPDFGRPERAGVAEGYLAYEQPGVLVVVPDALRAAAADGTADPLRLDLYLQERDVAVEEFALVTAGFRFDVATDTTRRDGGPQLSARPAPLADGVVRLVAPADLGVPEAALAPQPCDAAAARVLPLVVRLDGVAGHLLAGALRAGLVAFGAVVLVTVRGLAPRCPGALTVDVDALLGALAGGEHAVDDLQDRARAGLPGVAVTGGAGDDVQAAAVLDRVVTRFARPQFRDDTGGGWRFPDTWGGRTLLTWDLAEPAPAVRLLRLACDPVTSAASGAGAVHEHTAPPLTDGRERIVVHSTLPARPAGVVALGARLTAPPVPPARPFPAEAAVVLTPPQPAVTTLRLSSGEALVYDLAGTAVLETDAGPVSVAGPVRRVVGDSTPVVVPADLGVRLVQAHAAADLLALADVTVTARALRDDGNGAVVTSRAPIGPDGAWLAVPRDAVEVTLEATATTRTAPPVTVHQALPDAAIWLDTLSFPDAPWAAPSPDEIPIVVEVHGLRAVGPKGGADWRFLPLAAGPVRGPDGAPAVSLIEAAGLAMFMATTALLVADDDQAALRTACLAAGAPPDVRLAPAPFEAQEATLLLLRGAAQEPIATATPSGTVTEDAAFSVTLTPADVATVHRALAGEPGLLAVRYVLRVTATGLDAAALTGGPGPVVVVADAATWST